MLAFKSSRAKAVKQSQIRCRYGVTPEFVDSLLVKQGNKCAICKREFCEERLPYIDHIHDSGWVREILCMPCNMAIGQFDEDVDRMQRAIEYLIDNATPTEFNFYAQKLVVRLRPSRCRAGVVLSSETKDKISVSKKGRSPAWNKGKPWSDEAKSKMSVSRKKYLSTLSSSEKSELGRQGAAARWGKV